MVDGIKEIILPRGASRFTLFAGVLKLSSLRTSIAVCNQLDEELMKEKLVEQTQDKLAGKRIAERMVSFFDPEARAIVKGKLDKPVGFGRTLQLVQDDSGVIVHYEIHRGNPSDKTELISLVRQTKKVLKHAPRELATERTYYSAENLSKLHRLGVRRVGIPKIGR
jgi:IS5 family transposase